MILVGASIERLVKRELKREVPTRSILEFFKVSENGLQDPMRHREQDPRCRYFEGLLACRRSSLQMNRPAISFQRQGRPCPSGNRHPMNFVGPQWTLASFL